MSSKIEKSFESITAAILTSITVQIVFEAIIITAISAVVGGIIGFFVKRLLVPVWEYKLKVWWEDKVKGWGGKK